MRTLIVASLACAFLGFGCASANSGGSASINSTGAPREGLLVWIANNNVVTAEVEGHDLIGPTVRLSRSPDAQMQGTVFDRPVSVTFRSGRASGVLGDQPFNLSLQDERNETAGVTHVRGLVAGELSDYEMGANKLSGHVGRCGYELTGDEKLFDGYRSCGGIRERVRIEIGSRFSTWSSLEKATILAMLLRN